ncbi:hypothetical protein MMC19_004704 [Ptychographa xylographoides]|nr:hypothetical protein [Ptychographa xylographoides]
MATQTIELPFTLRSKDGIATVKMQTNNDPAHWGINVIFPGMNTSFTKGFPVCQATISYDREGYDSIFGWVQVIKSEGSNPPNEYEMDEPPALRGLDTPFIVYGVKPTLFDSPCTDDRPEDDWRAQSFLCYLEDALMTRHVKPLVAFTWGYDLNGGSVSVKKAEVLGLEAWDARLDLLKKKYPSWTFHGADAK